MSDDPEAPQTMAQNSAAYKALLHLRQARRDLSNARDRLDRTVDRLLDGEYRRGIAADLTDVLTIAENSACFHVRSAQRILAPDLQEK